ncbi:MAG: phage tail sheath C-terminal domain-containing protein, partial [Blastocatellia bacterium]
LTQGDLNSNGIDIARNFTSEGNGRVQWAARTISTNPLYRFVNTPITLNVLEVSIETTLKQYVFGVIDGQGQLASAIKDTLNQMLWTMWSQGVLYGATFGQACKVVVDTSDPLQLQNGILPISVYVKTSPIAERIPVTVLLMQLGYNPETGEVTVGNIDTQPDNVLAA